MESPTATATLRYSHIETAILALESALAFSAYLGAIGLLTAIDGSNLGMTTEILRGTPFHDFLVPGVLLLFANGVLPTIVVVAALWRVPWASWGHLVVGCTLMGWIACQIALVGYLSPLQPIYFAIGATIAVLALLLQPPKVPADLKQS